MKKFCALLLCILMMLGAVTSCSGNTSSGSAAETSINSNSDVNEEVTAEAPETEFSVFDKLPEKDFGGYEYRIVTGSNSYSEYLERMIVSEMTGDVIFDSVYERNLSVEDKYNCKIGKVVKEYDGIANYLVSDVLAGDNSFDLVQGALDKLPPLVLKDVLYDVRKLEHVDFSQPWYPQITNHDLCINGKQFLVQSELTVTTFANSYTMFYNIDLGNDYNINVDEIYNTVISGNWTIDKLTGYIKGTYVDLNSDGVMDSLDQVGYSTFGDEPLVALQYGMGQFTTKWDSNGMPVSAFDAERFTTIIEKLNNIFYNTGDGFLSSAWDGAINMFRDGQSLFMTCIMMHADRRLRVMEDRYTVLPMPKLNEEQSAYYTSISPGSAQLFVMPVTLSDAERSGIIFEALSAQGYKLVKPAFFEIALKVKYSRDDNVSKMYDMVADSRMIDFGYYYDGGTGMLKLIYNPVKKNNTDVASAYAKIEPKTTEYYKTVTDYYFN